MQKSLLKNSIFNIIYTVSNILFPFVTSIYVSRILLPAGVGKVAGAQNLVSYFVTLAALGLPSYGVREFAKVRENSERKDTLFTELFIINLISTTISIVAYAALLIWNSGFNNEWTLYICCGLTILFNYLNIDWIYQGLEEYGYITGRSIAIKIVSLFLLVALVRTKEDYVIYALLTSLALGGNYIFNVIHAHKIVRFSFAGLNIKKHIKPVAVIAGIIFMSTIYNKVDVTMLKMLSTDEAIGYYSYAQKTVNIVLTMCSAVTATFLPRLSYYYENDKNGFYKLFDKGFQILCFGVIPLAIGLFIVAQQAVILLYGNDFAPTGETIRLMCPLILIKGFGDLLCYQLAYSSKNERILLPASTFASVINIIANAILIPIYSQNGAVIASVLSELTTNVIQFVYLYRKVKYHIEIKAIVMAFVSSLVMAICVYSLINPKLSLAVALIVEIGLGGVSYLIMNLLMKNQVMVELLSKVLKKSRTKI
ncbi:oligosaccharide flippase family protein [Faecalibacterium prausnitzii]|uniref:Flippase n=1 Tax=Faecalibacterium prausnitzii TaxID=853 RepID=A0A329TQL1_9FIRM|nr:oligosaccharide flippase family protein [Faecalibacterium prausnitzii]RAW51263.1 flippase [Faecalibacterium prausnitzii]